MKIIEKHELTIARQGDVIQSYIRQLHELQAKQGGDGVGPTRSD